MTHKGYPVTNYNTAPTGGHDLEALKKKGLTWTILGFLCSGMIGGILGLIGYLKVDTEPDTAATLIKWSKIVTIIGMVIAVLIILLYVVLIVIVGVGASTTGTY